MEKDEALFWLSLIILFRLAFRFVTLLDPVLGMVLFYNVPLMLGFPRLFLLSYPFIMGIAETYLVVALGRGRFPLGPLLGYFVVVIVFEFPYALLKSGDSGLILFALVWYATAPAWSLLNPASPMENPLTSGTEVSLVVLMRIEDVYIWDINAKWLGITPYQLMENAGAGVARTIEEKLGKGLKIAVFSGTGNNGGDGFVVARHLSFENEVTLFLVGDEARIRSEEARHNWEILKTLDFVEIRVLRDSAYIRPLDLSGYDVIVDALLGAGTKGEPREPIRSAIEKINEYAGRARIVSIDLPSGYPSKIRVKADFAVTFQWDKEEYSGFERVIAKIGYPRELYHLVGPGDAKFALQKRGEHKGQNGRLLVIGGGEDYFGAPYLASKAASYIVDLVYLAMPEYSARRIGDPDLILRPVDGRNFGPEHVDSLLQLANKADAVVIGPGIGLKEEAKAFVREFIKRCDRPFVIDADALKAVAEDLSVLNGKTFVLTPHAGEFKILFGVKPDGPLVDRAELVMQKAKEIGGVVLLKGPYDIVSDGKIWKYNKTGNRGMTTGGTGDVLAGLVGALIALGNEPLRAAGVGAFLNGLAGDTVKEELGENFTALEVAKKVPHAVKWILEF